MSKSKKYRLLVTESDSNWKAQILRQATSKKEIVSKEKADFSSEAEATEWGETQLSEFTNTLSARNQRHGTQRKNNENTKQERSARRAEKTLKAKLEKSASTDDESA